MIFAKVEYFHKVSEKSLLIEFLMSVESAYCRTRHPVAAMLRGLVIMYDNRVAENGGRSSERQVGISEEAPRAGQLTASAGNGQGRHLVDQISYFTLGGVVLALAGFVNTKQKMKH
jgi:hypothetical protein